MNWRSFDRISLGVIAALWIWKVTEYAGRESGLLERNLGWGYYVSFAIPVIGTIAFLSILAVRNIARRLR